MIKAKKIFKYFSQIISWSVIILLVVFGLFLVLIFTTSKFSSKDNKSSPMGLFTIISPSMTPNIEVYDVVFAMQTSPEKIKVGDIITFYSKNEFLKGTPVTHRVTKITTTNAGKKFNTKGDGNDAHDAEEIYESEVVGKVYFKIPKLGRLQFWLTSKSSLFIVILIPALIIIAYDLYKMLKRIAFKASNVEVKSNNVALTSTPVTQSVPVAQTAPIATAQNVVPVVQAQSVSTAVPASVFKVEVSVKPSFILPPVPVVKAPEPIIILPQEEIKQEPVIVISEEEIKQEPIVVIPEIEIKQEPVIVISEEKVQQKPIELQTEKQKPIIIQEKVDNNKTPKIIKKSVNNKKENNNKHFKNKEKYNNVLKHKKKKKHGKVKKS